MTVIYRDQVSWTAEVVRQLSEAGFTAEIRIGFPLVPSPADRLEKERLIDFWPDVQPPARKDIRSEGMWFMPNFK